MPVKVNLNPWLSQSAGGQEAINVMGSTVSECLDKINAQFPRIKEHLMDKEGKIRSYILISLNGENINPGGLSQTVKNGDEISILFVMDGG